MKMKKDKHITEVIFRKFRNGGDIIAIFPALLGTEKWWIDCRSYQHVGQHGACTLDYVSITRPATFEEVTPLFKELENLGYNLKRIPAMRQQHLQARKQACERLSA